MAAARKTGPRPGLSRDKILDAAIAFVDEHGLTALSTRKLGAALGVEGMTLYYYVPNKAALLDGMAERLLQRSLGDLLPDPGTPWPEAMRQKRQSGTGPILTCVRLDGAPTYMVRVTANPRCTTPLVRGPCLPAVAAGASQNWR